MLSRRFLSLIIITTALKVALILWTPYSGDFSNWVRGAGYSFLLFSKAQLPTPNAYAGLEAILAPFYWLWTVLPIPHPALNEMVGQYSTAELALVFVMKIPALAFDLFAGFLLYELVRDRTGVERKGWIAFLVWYLNPYNIYWMYYYGGFDVIPTAILLLAVVYGNGGKWIQSGLCASLAAILRLFPFALFPFFVVYVGQAGIAACRKNVEWFALAARHCISQRGTRLGFSERCLTSSGENPRISAVVGGLLGVSLGLRQRVLQAHSVSPHNSAILLHSILARRRRAT